MPTLSITKSYSNGNLLYEADLDNFKTGIETFVNATKLDSTNIQAGGVASSNIANAAITSSLIANGAVGTTALVDSSVTAAKLAAYVLGSSTTDNNNTTYNSSGTDQSLGSKAITVSGVRPVLVGFRPSPGGGQSSIAHTGSGSVTRFLKFGDGTTTVSLALTPNATLSLSMYFHVFYPSAAGSVTYTAYFSGLSGDAAVVYGQVFALEL